mmetsp:Transcript_70513/g.223394  ORF Transcript_70513/g.223394 Transcript_70513/m.223394 type:complete len:277 (-) Transcript_70513:763-1593(-)
MTGRRWWKREGGTPACPRIASRELMYSLRRLWSSKLSAFIMYRHSFSCARLSAHSAPGAGVANEPKERTDTLSRSASSALQRSRSCWHSRDLATSCWESAPWSVPRVLTSPARLARHASSSSSIVPHTSRSSSVRSGGSGGITPIAPVLVSPHWNTSAARGSAGPAAAAAARKAAVRSALNELPATLPCSWYPPWKGLGTADGAAPRSSSCCLSDSTVAACPRCPSSSPMQSFCVALCTCPAVCESPLPPPPPAPRSSPSVARTSSDWPPSCAFAC